MTNETRECVLYITFNIISVTTYYPPKGNHVFTSLSFIHGYQFHLRPQFYPSLKDVNVANEYFSLKIFIANLIYNKH